jgi:isoprenylcysteine carboxyl methyltransferase (ICMT) family protein YpbQ
MNSRDDDELARGQRMSSRLRQRIGMTNGPENTATYLLLGAAFLIMAAFWVTASAAFAGAFAAIGIVWLLRAVYVKRRS